MSAAVVIPARYASTRCPGKPLLKGPQGKPLIQYVWEAASGAEGVNRVVVATDDARIFDAVTAFGGEAQMTASDHASGSDRVAEVARSLDHDVVVNLQGDEPAMTAEMISTAIGLLDDDPECAIGTLAAPIESEDELADPNVVKVVVDERWRALYFSRAVIPHVRGATRPLHESPSPHMAHLGIYAYRRDSLLRYAAMPPHPLEQAEKLEQLRALACGFTIKVALTASRMHKVDTPEDFALFCRFLEQRANSGSRP